MLFNSSFEAKRMLLLFGEPPPAAGVSGPPPAANYARFTKDGPNDIEIAAGVGGQGGFLVLDDTYDDDWHVEVDGQPAPMLKADALFRAVRLAPGEHRVQFHYRPQPVLYGALLSGGALLGLLATALWPRRQRAISSVEVPLSVASTPTL
jgi:hypothetical protein